MGIWLEWDRVPQGVATQPYPGATSYVLLLGDDRPYLIGAYGGLSGILPDGRYYEANFFPAPPSGIPKVTATLYPQPAAGERVPKSSTALASWTWENRGAPAATNWLAPPLPQRSLVGDLEVTLVELVMNASGRQELGRSRLAATSVDASAGAKFVFQQNGRPTTNWQVESIISLTDSIGNRGVLIEWTQDPDYLHWRWPLWPNQPWRVAFVFTRMGGFESNELVTVTGLLPGRVPSGEIEYAAGTVKLTSLEPVNWDPMKLELSVAFTTRESPGRLTLIAVTDGKGKALQGNLSSWSGGMSRFHIDSWQSNRGPLNVTFALHVGRVAEFLVEPQFAVLPARKRP